MSMNYRLLCVELIFSIVFTCSFQSIGLAVEPRFTWLLPKTVIDATFVYTYEDCSADGLTFKITSTLAPRTIPDPLVVGRIETADLQSAWQDGNISVQTYGASHILSSLGSSPANQVAQIAGNVLGGIAKLVAVAFGVAPIPAAQAPAPPAPKCATGPDSAQSIKAQIDVLKKAIEDLQKQLANGVDDATQKKDTATIQSAQSLISSLQGQLTFTITTTIDPGVTPVAVKPEGGFYPPTKESVVDHSGLIATICPSVKQLQKWFDNATPCAVAPLLEVNVYLDFSTALDTMYFANHEGPYQQTEVPAGYQYRDVAHIPVLVWRGARQMPGSQSQVGKDGSPIGPVQLIAPQMMVFGQFGVAQQLPLSTGLFKTLTWSVNFLENGVMTSATFTSKASGVSATTFLGTAASAANSIATEEGNARSLSNQANTLQAQADIIYQSHRLALCEANPVQCPSK
jgi:hypothetical protein